MAECPDCGWDLIYVPDDSPKFFQCSHCKHRFEIEEDADWNGDHWQDTSGPGARIYEGGETRP